MQDCQLVQKQPNIKKSSHLCQLYSNNQIQFTSNIIPNIFFNSTDKAPYLPPHQQYYQSMENTLYTQKQQHLANNLYLDQLADKYPQHSIEQDKKLAKLSQAIRTKDKRIQHLQHQVNQLKQSQQYLIKIIQNFRDKGDFSISFGINQVIQIKDNQIEYLNKQISKLRVWLQQQKQQISHCLNCIQLKNQIIQNIENQHKKLQSTLKTTITLKKKDILNQTTKSQTYTQLLQQKNKCKQLQQKILKLIQQINTLKLSNKNISLQLINKHQHHSSQISSPINLLKNQSLHHHHNNNHHAITTDYLKYQLLSSKTYQLQNQIEKLMTKIVQLKQNNLYNNNCHHKINQEISFKYLQNHQNFEEESFHQQK